MRTLRESVNIYKGHKAPEVFDEPETNTRRYLQIEDLRPEATIKYARDPEGTVANRDDVIIAWDGANAGTVSFGLEGFIGSTLAILRPDPQEYFAPFLGYFLQSKVNFIRGSTTGATIPHVSRTALENLRLEPPPLPEQQRIAMVLDRADRLRRTRHYAQQLSDSLLEAVFVKMVGNPETNPKKWEIVSMDEICREITVGYVGPMVTEYADSGIPFLRSQNVTPFHLRLSSVKYISPKFHDKLRKSQLSPNDIVVVRTGNAGDACVVPDTLGRANCADLVIIKTRPAVNNHFLVSLLNSSWGRIKVTGNMVGQVQRHFNIGAAKEMHLPLPPLCLQQKFARIVQQFERLSAQQREAERQAEHLFQTLLHKTFDEGA